ncbi:MAG: hypothetical protein LBT17_01020 [Mycoplasmataceae bacterium]|jgi:hypothetical protein|nr:hypothetical protein [Mycoplasmataceae bacterium]
MELEKNSVQSTETGQIPANPKLTSKETDVTSQWAKKRRKMFWAIGGIGGGVLVATGAAVGIYFAVNKQDNDAKIRKEITEYLAGHTTPIAAANWKTTDNPSGAPASGQDDETMLSWLTTNVNTQNIVNGMLASFMLSMDEVTTTFQDFNITTNADTSITFFVKIKEVMSGQTMAVENTSNVLLSSGRLKMISDAKVDGKETKTNYDGLLTEGFQALPYGQGTVSQCLLFDDETQQEVYKQIQCLLYDKDTEGLVLPDYV